MSWRSRPSRWPVAAIGLAFAIGCGRPSGEAAANASAVAPAAGAVPAIQQFNADIFDASGAAQLPDGRVLIVEDDERNPLTIVDVLGARKPRSFAPRELKRVLATWGTGALNDLEALTIDPRGHLYASTSHALTTKGVAKQEREQLVRFDLAGNRLIDLRVSTQLKSALGSLDPIFASAAQTSDAEGRGGLNIEGLAWDPGQSRLLIGFRSPRRGREALVVWLKNPDAVFERKEAPSLLPPVELNLEGEGIRDVTYSPTVHGFFIVAGAWRHNKHTSPTLWFWTGGAERAVKLQASGFEDLNPEGLAEIVIPGGRALLMVSDDGGGDELFYRGRSLENHGIRARYVILSLDQLRRDNPSLK